MPAQPRPPTDPQLPELGALRAFAERVLGPGLVVEDRSRTFGRESVVWRITSPDGAARYLKRHETPVHYTRSAAALRDWTRRLGEAPWFRVPRLIAHDDDVEALIITEVNGTIAEEFRDDTARSAVAHRLAGRFLARLHALPIDVTQSNVSALLAEKAARYLATAENAFPAGVLDWVRERFAEPLFLADTPLVATHMDFSPRNWLIAAEEFSPVIGVIDWERARPDVWFEDPQRMVMDHWHAAPSLREAFFDGYGRTPSSEEDRRLDLFVLLNTVASVPWAQKRGDRHFEQLSRRALERVRARLDAR